MTDRIDRSALNEDDRAFLDKLDSERGLLQQVSATFTGPLRYWTAYALVMSVVVFGLSVYAFVRLIGAGTMPEVAVWLAVFVWASVAVGLIKIWFWMRMNHLELLREVKRLELRLVERP